jgi:hypothetical protein
VIEKIGEGAIHFDHFRETLLEAGMSGKVSEAMACIWFDDYSLDLC